MLAALLVAAFAVGQDLRGDLGPVTLESLRQSVEALGWRGPVIYLGLVTFRQFLLLPSAIVLSAGGLCFGVAVGTALGSAGIVLSGLMKFGVARGIARSWIESRLEGRLAPWRTRIETAGPLVVALATAHPLGPMAPAHWAAGLSSIPIGPFLLALLLASPLRAAAYSFFGSILLQAESGWFTVAAAALLLLILCPLLHPAVRRQIFILTRRV